ncbi:hypothetical protein GLOIN_2v141924 [Rhizophagus clarus]|uniref:Uncharacterized protein n=1 Tax=Rhizophagus clarus TaxID=94130 RepID=A0A8H3L175_9GLOM|nr:hypothetical protein GLOIN_2v141924 [Rhizophagus clarus]
MSSMYRKELIKAAIVNYWNRKTASREVGLLDCLQKIDSKINLKSDEKQYVHSIYFSHLAMISHENSINQVVKNRIISENENRWQPTLT